MTFAFVDESGDPADPRTTKTRSRYLLVVAVVAAHPRSVALHVRRARRAAGGQLPGGEFKGRHVQPKLIQRLLVALAEEDIRPYVRTVT